MAMISKVGDFMNRLWRLKEDYLTPQRKDGITDYTYKGDFVFNAYAGERLDWMWLESDDAEMASGLVITAAVQDVVWRLR